MVCAEITAWLACPNSASHAVVVIFSSETESRFGVITGSPSTDSRLSVPSNWNEMPPQYCPPTVGRKMSCGCSLAAVVPVACTPGIRK